MLGFITGFMFSWFQKNKKNGDDRHFFLSRTYIMTPAYPPKNPAYKNVNSSTAR